jgi:peptidoglycan hydrolase-like protein with peptidoglycan-binding domain
MFSTESSFIALKVIVTTIIFLSLSLVPARADDLTMMIEEHLASLGYDTGTVDGEADVKTAVAISQFQAEKGLEVTGKASPQLAGILAAEINSARPAAGESSETLPSEVPDLHPDEIKAAQQACLQQKVAEAQQAQQKKKKGLGSAFASLTKSVVKYGNNDLAEISADIYEAGATANDLAEAARELGISESDIADCQAPAAQVAGSAATAGATVASAPATHSPASAVATTSPAATVGQESTYAARKYFRDGSQWIAYLDAVIEKCQGTREGYSSRFDSLVSVAHPEYRAEAMARYLKQYSDYKQLIDTMPGPHTPLGPCSDLDEFKANANDSLDRLGPGCAKVYQCASTSTATMTSVQGTANASSPKSAAFEAAISRAQTLLEACKKILEENPGPSLGEFSGGRGSAPLPASDIERKQESNRIANTCVSECTGAKYRLDNARPDQPIEAFNSYVSACESSYSDASAL